MVRSGELPVGGASRSVDAIDAVPAPVLFCPFPARISPYAADLSRYIMWWATRHGFLPNAAAGARFARSRFASLTARAYPRAERPALFLAASWLTFIVVLDDHLETVLGREPERQREAAAAMVALLRSGEPAPRGGPQPLVPLLGRSLAGALAEVWAGTAARTSPAWRERFIGHFARYLDANAWEADNRRAGRVPTIGCFVAMRRHTSAVAPFFDLIEAVNGVELNPRALADPLLTEAYARAGNAVAWFNDLVSWPKELRDGDPHNLVLVVRNARQGTFADAVRDVVDRHDAEVRAFVEVQARLHDRPELRVVVDGLASWIRGPIDWSCESERYAAPVDAAAE